jgi:replicative DNA helicase
MTPDESNELQIIGGLLRHPDQVARVDVNAADFVLPLAGQAFAAMRAITAAGGVVDVFGVAERLGGGLMVGELATIWKECLIRPEALSQRCARLKALSRGRQTADLLKLAITTLEDGKDPDAVRARLIAKLAGLESSGTTHTHTAKETMGLVTDYLQAAFDARQAGGLVGVPSGIRGLDTLLGGFHKSDLIVIGARPAMGKTALMGSVAHYAATQGRRVGIASAEMPAVQIGLRAVSALGDIHSTKLRACDLDENEFSRLTEAASRYATLPIAIYDKPACTPADIALQARAWQLSGGLDLLMVDYLTRLTPDDPTDSRTREVGRMVASLKTLAKSLDIPVICFAQLSRVCEQRADKRPVMSDLRDSGEIEQEADCVAFLYRDAVYNEQADPESAEILIEKNRHGPCARVMARFIPERMLWTNA